MSKRIGKHPGTVRIASAFGALLAAAACAPLPSIPLDGATDFAVADPALGNEVSRAADDWARAGLEVADYVTVNQAVFAVPVSLVSRERLVVECHLDAPADADGCTWYHRGGFHGVFIADDLTPERLAVVVRHEIIHVLVPRAEHLPDSVTAVFSEHGFNAAAITDADMAEMARHADVVLVHEWPLTDAAAH